MWLFLVFLLPSALSLSLSVPDGCDRVSVGACVFEIPLGQPAVDVSDCSIPIPYCKRGEEFTITAHVTNTGDGDSLFVWQTPNEMIEIIATTTQVRVMTSAEAFDDFAYHSPRGLLRISLLFEDNDSVLSVQLNDNPPVRVPHKHTDDLDWTLCLVPKSTASILSIGNETLFSLVHYYSGGLCGKKLVPFVDTDPGHAQHFYFPNATVYGTENRRLEIDSLTTLNCQYEMASKPIQINPLNVDVKFCTDDDCAASRVSIDMI